MFGGVGLVTPTGKAIVHWIGCINEKVAITQLRNELTGLQFHCYNCMKSK